MDDSYAHMFGDSYGMRQSHHSRPQYDHRTTSDTALWKTDSDSSQSIQLPNHLAQSCPAVSYGGLTHANQITHTSLQLTPPIAMGDPVHANPLPSPHGTIPSRSMALPCGSYLTPMSQLPTPSCPGQMDYGFPQSPSYLQPVLSPATSPMTAPAIATRSTRAVARSPAHKVVPSRESVEPPAKFRKPAAKRGASTPVTKSSRVPHSIVERRYRNNLRSQLDTLTKHVPAMKESYGCSLDMEDAGRAIKGPSKAVVISAAVKHIEKLEAENARSREFSRSLQTQIEGLQKLVRCDECSILRYLQGMQMLTPQSEHNPGAIGGQ